MVCVYVCVYIYICIYTHIYVCVYTHTGLLTIKKNEMLPFAATWMDIENITLSEIRQRKTNTV